ncbi:MAG: hypothetical protein SF051_02295, partial [Elusimicrobiota bacterium]|nr:hypothetical protein [Elusimicrobiota bacterium]
MRTWLAAVLLLAAPASAQDALDRALSAELGRAKRELRADGFAPPYFVAADVWDYEERQAWAQLGRPVAETSQKQRIALFDLRVGSRELDNHPLEPKSDYAAQAVPGVDDEGVLRHAFWLMLDNAYKTASGDHLRKKAQRVQKGKADYDADDLAPEPPRERRLPPPAPVDAAPALAAAAA